ncbi:MAG: metallopeptidase family protein [Clostridiales bacterium]|nr:metallopeptidase family protein [Clostridiales bacterium]
MISFEDAGTILDEIAEELPEEFYRELNGGIVLLHRSKLHARSLDPSRLYILGQYHYQPRGLGRYIEIYYGSFRRVYGHLDPERQKEELRRVLLHEFTHHIESLAGERGLEIKDAIRMEEYRKKFNQ